MFSNKVHSEFSYLTTVFKHRLYIKDTRSHFKITLFFHNDLPGCNVSYTTTEMERTPYFMLNSTIYYVESSTNVISVV